MPRKKNAQRKQFRIVLLDGTVQYMVGTNARDVARHYARRMALALWQVDQVTECEKEGVTV